MAVCRFKFTVCHYHIGLTMAWWWYFISAE